MRKIALEKAAEQELADGMESLEIVVKLSAEYSKIGLQINSSNTVVGFTKGGAAERVGQFLIGDTIVDVNGVAVSTISRDLP